MKSPIYLKLHAVSVDSLVVLNGCLLILNSQSLNNFHGIVLGLRTYQALMPLRNVVDFELGRLHLFADRTNEGFQIPKMKIGREEGLIRHRGVEFLACAVTVFTKRDLATFDREIPRFGLLAKE